MALGETAGLKAAMHVFPLFVGATIALFLNPPKQKWAVPVLLIIFMGVGEVTGPVLQSSFAFLKDHASAAHLIGATLGWTVFKSAQKAIASFNPLKKVSSDV